METQEQISCDFCNACFTRKSSHKTHMDNRPGHCIRMEQLIVENTKIKAENLQLQKVANDAKKEGYLEASKHYETQIADLKASQNNSFQELLNCSATTRSRKKKMEDIQCRGKIKNFEKILEIANLDIAVIRNCCNSDADGDIVMFKRAVIDNTPKEEQCVRIRDFARDKYQYFNGVDWETVPLKFIAESFMDQLWYQYQKIILGEKKKEISELNANYPRWDPRYTEYNNNQFDAITDKYYNASHHYSSLGICCDTLKSNIMKGIKALITPDNTKGKQT